ncbi:dTMP kinase [Pseudomonas sp. NGC7]|uniref:dTMP kinase n=1 Tax=Pseudomonas sp. NGC7 TaxID=3341775 RepID=UPI0037DB0C0D
MPFLSIEGIDGSGKSEQVKRLVEHLRSLGHSVLQTKEPDGGHLGSEIRAILTHSDRKLSPTEQLLLVSAARYGHVEKVIRPALENGEWVISDRFVDSTYAYQVAVSDVDLHQLFRSVTDVVVGTTLPDFTFILDLPLEVARTRRDQRRDGVNDPAEATRDFASIRNGLSEVAAKNPKRCHIINADQQPDEVARDIWRIVERIL